MGQSQDLKKNIVLEGVQYVDSIAFSSNFETDRQPMLLGLINVDSAPGSYALDTHSSFSLIGFNSNLHVVPLLHFYMCGRRVSCHGRASGSSLSS